MERIDLKIGFNCNNSCLFCVQGRKRKVFGDKTLNKIINELREGKKISDRIVLTGGEPTLQMKKLISIIKTARDIGYHVIQVQSNGRLFAYLDFCKEMIAAGANEFSPALHGPNRKIHDFLTKSPGSFDETLEGIKNLIKLKQRVMTNTVITVQNYPLLPEVARLLVKLSVEQFQFAYPHILGSAAENKHWLIPKKTHVMRYVKLALAIGIKAGRRAMTEAIPYCFLDEYKECAAEKIIPTTKIYDADFVVNNYSIYRRKIGKSKGPQCVFCKFDDSCEGPWREYPQLFGWDEFRPILKNE